MVDNVVIYNRQDCCQNRINGAEVWVGTTKCGTVVYAASVSMYKIQCPEGGIEGAPSDDSSISAGDDMVTTSKKKLGHVRIEAKSIDTCLHMCRRGGRQNRRLFK